MNLYELAQNYLNLQELLENPEVPRELILESLGEVGGELEEKAENIAKLIKTIDLEVKAIEEEEKRLANNRKAMKNKSKALKDYLEGAMISTGKTKFKGNLFSFNIQKNAPSVDIIDENLIPKEFIEFEPIIKKKEILAALKNGEVIEGVRLKQTESLRIR
ncbi:siphovirus Gp157 family protein [Clostridium perfringens]|uniref:siphovirus Gp157 family protein n=1 Tax=Clostridium perfringens TaxID=1502 RepID=UPI0024BCD402|nr:siphovirus Gp157 family protein [Clostridium perfringens]